MDLFYMLQRFQDFKNSFRGDPQQMIRQMMDSGRFSQNDYDNAVEKANQFLNMFQSSCKKWK